MYSFWTAGDGVASGQLGTRMTGVFFWEGVLCRALTHLGTRVHTALEDGAVFNHTTVSRADIERFLQVGLVPTVLEITVKTVAGGVAVGQYESAGLAQVIDRFDIVQDFVKDRHQSDRVRSWAVTAVNIAGVSHVGLMILAVEVFAVPTTWEEDYEKLTLASCFLEKKDRSSYFALEDR